MPTTMTATTTPITAESTTGISVLLLKVAYWDGAGTVSDDAVSEMRVQRRVVPSQTANSCRHPSSLPSSGCNSVTGPSYMKATR